MHKNDRHDKKLQTKPVCKLWVFSKSQGVRRDSSEVIMTRHHAWDNIYETAKENELVSSLCIVKYCIRSSYVMLCICDMYFVFRCAKIRTLSFLCELSYQQHNNISGQAARYKIFGVNAHKEIIQF